MSVAEAKQRISSPEFTSWMAFAAVEPFGEKRRDLQSAMICSSIFQAFTGEVINPTEFLLKFSSSPENKDVEFQSPEQLERMLVSAFCGEG